MIPIKNKMAIQKMQTAGLLVAEIFELLKQHVVAGKTTFEINALIEKELQKRNLVSSTKGYKGYKFASCISINDEVVHGMPSERIVKDGDLVKVDICASWKGYCADSARCFFVGSPSAIALKLAQVAREALDKGIAQAKAGNKLTDISAAIQAEVETHGFGVVRDFAGHGIGKQMHEDPEILNYGKPGKGPVLRPGMTFAIEPMITQGNYAVYVAQDGWTVRTKDKSLAAHVEDTVLITEHEPLILTKINPS
ncbi:MAG: Methionine aminopeptidase 1 [Candidatus Dependentiae bacterium ADurb.Bin331]|nr:MAG: Methionine aminopeptidase 1 [Candidatus Dependentiae bacterium ADurb.Bin331]